jgi:DNA repair protein RadA/Sms
MSDHYHGAENDTLFEQVGNRAQRMGLGDAAGIYLFNATRLDDILREVVRMRPRAVVVDSIQTVYLDDVAGSAGSISQVCISLF